MNPLPELVLYVGPMFAGKTTELILACERDVIRGLSCVIIKFSKDNRYGNQPAILTHRGLEAQVDVIQADDLSTVDVSRYHTVGIDEVQFYTNFEVIPKWAASKRVICSGLNGDIHAKPFPALNYLYPHANKIKLLQSVCKVCKHNACYTRFIDVNDDVNNSINDDVNNIVNVNDNVNNNVINDDVNTDDTTNVIKIGGLESYIAVCRKCG